MRAEFAKSQKTIKWITLRHLLDDIRKLVVKDKGCIDWFAIPEDQRVIAATATIEKLMNQSSASFSSSAYDLAHYLANDHSEVRKEGNAATHSGTRETIEEAIRVMPLGQNDRKVLSNFYSLYFDADDV